MFCSRYEWKLGRRRRPNPLEGFALLIRTSHCPNRVKKTLTEQKSRSGHRVWNNENNGWVERQGGSSSGAPLLNRHHDTYKPLSKLRPKSNFPCFLMRWTSLVLSIRKTRWTNFDRMNNHLIHREGRFKCKIALFSTPCYFPCFWMRWTSLLSIRKTRCINFDRFVSPSPPIIFHALDEKDVVIHHCRYEIPRNSARFVSHDIHWERSHHCYLREPCISMLSSEGNFQLQLCRIRKREKETITLEPASYQSRFIQ